MTLHQLKTKKMKPKKSAQRILFLIIMTIICWIILAEITTTGITNPITFHEMKWGIDKAVIGWIITLCSMAPAAVIVSIIHIRNKFSTAQW